MSPLRSKIIIEMMEETKNLVSLLYGRISLNQVNSYHQESAKGKGCTLGRYDIYSQPLGS